MTTVSGEQSQTWLVTRRDVSNLALNSVQFHVFLIVNKE